MSNIFIDQLTIIGVGLIGGSVASRLRQEKCVGKIIGVGRGVSNLKLALSENLVDEITTDIVEAVKGANLIMIAVPVQQLPEVLLKIKESDNREAIITDVGSTKCDFLKHAEAIIPEFNRNVVPGHPIAGSERTGAKSADPSLFDARNVILCPLERTEDRALSIVRSVWEICGAHVRLMSTDEHDKIFSLISHLPHVVSYALVHMIARHRDSEQLFDYAAGGFRDFSRIAGSSPEMWADICRANEGQIVEDLDVFIANLEQIRDFLKAGKHDELTEIFESAANARYGWTAGT